MVPNKALGLTLREPSGLMVELAGRCGLDFVSFDAQHDPLTPAEIGEMCRIADPYGMTVSMRIPDGAESTILSYLDRGVRVIRPENRPRNWSSTASSRRSDCVAPPASPPCTARSTAITCACSRR